VVIVEVSGVYCRKEGGRKWESSRIIYCSVSSHSQPTGERLKIVIQFVAM